MTETRSIEVFSAGCPVCEEFVRTVIEEACPSCEVTVREMEDASAAERAEVLGVTSLPAVAIDGELADCCTGRGPDLDVLRARGLGKRA